MNWGTMRETAFVVGFNLAVTCAFARAAGVVILAARSVAMRHRFEALRFGAAELIVVPEPVLLAAAAYVLLVNRESSSAVSGVEAAAALAGGLVALAGLALVVWTLLSWRQLFVGHGVLGDQELVTFGAFGVVRHPVYLGALLIWSGLSLSFLSPAAAAITVLYVLPAYLLYIRSEEAMMLDSFGDQYCRYRREVPMLLPDPRRRRA
jgi:protein-S-isoprenylcysteine O-methyltransferase Ste14